ncbi:MAG: tRNA pseudouridine(55) synthase TruB [Candidatus Doudnabacteria bacterium RIFCSPHIGHO2_02_FULL_46_11]|uniref:tRNA pseudouridine synthase B n=1 Tax=Candidatus Doudnabacteria bacterium RIFCSPHIGHO2_02_FULL_46_11 TaxID=1817832 RepID=A0A1F5P418_9BACT|nr:MAG: tRNA pseudouridine(55) synthase TruB [Candidatus Doudnabacteria bacterium RIFCSPHIGHO2_02_FULL_46_11]
MQGFYLINKPAGPTSHDVVDRLREITGEKTIGHAGTLDPQACGLLIIAVGREYTKQIAKFVGMDKEYEAEITFGKTSTTYDAEGKLTEVSGQAPSKEQIEQVLKSLEGEVMQTPPIFSAKRVKGKKAYQLAREGKPVDLEPVRVTIYYIKLIKYKYPKLEILTKVSSGTYIRALANEIGLTLNVGGYLTALKRTKVGEFYLKDAIDLDHITATEDLVKVKIEAP